MELLPIYIGSPWPKDWPEMRIAFEKSTFRRPSDVEYSVDTWCQYWKSLDEMELQVDAAPSQNGGCFTINENGEFYHLCHAWNTRNARRHVFSLATYLTGGNIPSPTEAGFFGTDQVFGWPNTILKESNKTIFEHVQENNLYDDMLREYLDEMKTIGHALPIGQHKRYEPYINIGYGYVESKWCKYSFNEDNRPTDVLGDE
ncbi:hypothetical protein IV203_003945 [Nitzschia inconspicua]|uniref:Uncharacterized protein n=1 Tax=Nitzschia inconspicua TaxID=303405 RepID=A0A9K3L2T7_9STRA|nr:hypothetical protein IV203_003945 [Nitzschia inconspicua]